MTQEQTPKKVERAFKLTNLALENKTSVFLLTFLLVVFGIYSYVSLPKELFPDINFPTIVVHTVYPGNSPLDMENLVTRPLEKELDGVKGLKKLSSTSAQDASVIYVEFNTDVSIKDALGECKDAVDEAQGELPDDLPNKPGCTDIDFSEFPVITINLSGDFSTNEFKDYAEFIKDEVEDISEVSKVKISGLNEREVRVMIDVYKMDANMISFADVESAIANENVSMSGGELLLGDMQRALRVVGEFGSVQEIEDVIVKRDQGNVVYLRDIAQVEYAYEYPKSFARLNALPVVSLQVVKKGGENLLSAIDQVRERMRQAQASAVLPAALHVSYTNDQSDQVRKQISNLENSLIMGVFFVVLVLFFFLGTRNALFVGFAIPTSMFIAFVVFNMMGYNINMIVLFALILALGMLVDNAIVVVENVYRFVSEGQSADSSSRRAVGEIAMPIISSTMTTLAAFFPLLFWDSMMGEFMRFLPMTLIIVLSSSLFVALVLVPVFTAVFMKKDKGNERIDKKKAWRATMMLAAFSLCCYLLGWRVMGGMAAFFALVGCCNILFLNRLGNWFKLVFLRRLELFYEKILAFAIGGRNTVWFIGGTLILLLLTFVLMAVKPPKTVFFPSSYPAYINVLAELPIGTDVKATNAFVLDLERDVDSLMQPYSKIVKNVLTTVGEGSEGENDVFSMAAMSSKARITINFIDFEYRQGINTFEVLKVLNESLHNKYPGVYIAVEKPLEGPPTGKPVNIELSGEHYPSLLALGDSVMQLIERSGIQGIEGLKMDLDVGNPELIVRIDRDKARRIGLSTGQIAMNIRTSLFGKEVSKFKQGEDEYPIQLRLQDTYRYNVSSLLNQKITFRNNSGKLLQIPIASVADITYATTYDAVNRKNMDRVITLGSNVIEGYNANEINDKLKALLSAYVMPEGYQYEFTGEQEEQAKSFAFLVQALLIAIALITIILVSQFNSIVKPLIIMASVLFSTIGVFGGLITFQMNFIVIMTGIGIVSLAGVVVNNAIVLIDYIDYLKKQKKHQLGMANTDSLSREQEMACVVEAGKTRLRPVLLTAITTILGLLPMALGLNINFETMLTHFDPQIFWGGDNMIFWGPLSWTVIFGLSFATFLTLVIVPAMYHFAYLVKARTKRMFHAQ